MTSLTKARPLSTWILISCGVWLVILGLYFIFLRPPFLPEDPRFMGTTLEKLQMAVPGLARWLDNVFIVMGGFMASTGVLTVFVASVALPARLPGASWATALSGVLSKVVFRIVDKDGNKKTMERTIVEWINIKKKGGEGFIKRPVIKLDFCLGGKQVEARANLADRSDFLYPVLIGRNVLKAGDFMIDPEETFTHAPGCR